MELIINAVCFVQIQETHGADVKKGAGQSDNQSDMICVAANGKTSHGDAGQSDNRAAMIHLESETKESTMARTLRKGWEISKAGNARVEIMPSRTHGTDGKVKDRRKDRRATKVSLRRDHDSF